MGLAGPKNRRKLDYDPNNTRWSRDETTFGQKILRAHGWQPGGFLGAADASHSEYHTIASSAPIKINLKDDNLGLGARPRQKQSDECTGLNSFKDLLSRLNGKAEETIKVEQQVRSDLKTSLFVERRYGTMRFVSGGLLVGDQINKAIKDQLAATAEVDREELEEKPKRNKKSKKRKLEEPDTNDVSDLSHKKKRKRDSKEDSSLRDKSLAGAVSKSEKKKKKSKESTKKVGSLTDCSETKKKKKNRIVGEELAAADHCGKTAVDVVTVFSEDIEAVKSKNKKDKKERREKKKRESPEISSPAIETAASEELSPLAASNIPQESGTSTPIGTGTSTPSYMATRHRVRSRNIASKRLAMADMSALNQIFMVKPV